MDQCCDVGAGFSLGLAGASFAPIPEDCVSSSTEAALVFAWKHSSWDAARILEGKPMTRWLFRCLYFLTDLEPLKRWIWLELFG